MMENQNLSQELQSKVIDFLRFPLIIGVIFIHNSSSNLIINGKVFGSESIMPFFYYSSQLFSQTLARIAVPLFFFISGFLFFLNVNEFSYDSFKSKLISRIRTLLIPYIFWNLVVFILYYTLQSIPALSGYVNYYVDFKHFFSYFWDTIGATKDGIVQKPNMPIAYQFWFIRDLMIVVLITPILYLLCKYTRLYGIVFLAILWFFESHYTLDIFRLVSIFFFTTGAYLGINKHNLISEFSKIKNLSFILYPFLLLVDLFTKDYPVNIYFHKMGIIVGIIMCFNLVVLLFQKEKIKSLPFLSAASFFVFAFHEPLLKTLRKVTFLIFKPESDLLLTSLYFFNVIIVVVFTLLVYGFMNRIFPKFTAIITGGR